MTTLLIKIQLTSKTRRQSLVCAVTRVRAGLPGQRSLIPGWARGCSLPDSDQTGSGAHPSTLYSINFRKEGASSSVGDVDCHVIIINVLYSLFNRIPVLIVPGGIQICVQRTPFRKVHYTKYYDITWFVMQTDFTSRCIPSYFIK